MLGEHSNKKSNKKINYIQIIIIDNCYLSSARKSRWFDRTEWENRARWCDHLRWDRWTKILKNDRRNDVWPRCLVFNAFTTAVLWLILVYAASVRASCWERMSKATSVRRQQQQKQQVYAWQFVLDTTIADNTNDTTMTTTGLIDFNVFVSKRARGHCRLRWFWLQAQIDKNKKKKLTSAWRRFYTLRGLEFTHYRLHKLCPNFCNAAKWCRCFKNVSITLYLSDPTLFNMLLAAAIKVCVADLKHVDLMYVFIRMIYI